MPPTISRKPWTSKTQPDGKGAALIDADSNVIAIFKDWRDCEAVAQNCKYIDLSVAQTVMTSGMPSPR